MKFAFIHAERHAHPIGLLCRVLGVSRAGFYAWRDRPESHRQQQDMQLTRHIQDVHQRSKGRYGAPRVHAELQAQGVSCGRQRVARLASRRLEPLMRTAGLRGKGKRKYRVTTRSDHDHPLAGNVLGRQFDVSEPNAVWAGDLTYLPTKEGWLYLAVLIDLYSRRVMGWRRGAPSRWAMSERITTALPLKALQMACKGRRPPPGLVHYSDRGSQYASWAYQRALRMMGSVPSMSLKGDCWDNAVVESFFASLKRELLDGRGFASWVQARLEVFEYLEVFFNRQRRHSTLGFLAPVVYEEQRRVA